MKGEMKMYGVVWDYVDYRGYQREAKRETYLFDSESEAIAIFKKASDTSGRNNEVRLFKMEEIKL